MSGHHGGGHESHGGGGGGEGIKIPEGMGALVLLLFFILAVAPALGVETMGRLM